MKNKDTMIYYNHCIQYFFLGRISIPNPLGTLAIQWSFFSNIPSFVIH